MKKKSASAAPSLPTETLMLMAALATALLDAWDRGYLQSPGPMIDMMRPTLRAYIAAGDPPAVIREVLRMIDTGILLLTGEANSDFREALKHARAALDLLPEAA